MKLFILLLLLLLIIIICNFLVFYIIVINTSNNSNSNSNKRYAIVMGDSRDISKNNALTSVFINLLYTCQFTDHDLLFYQYKDNSFKIRERERYFAWYKILAVNHSLHVGSYETVLWLDLDAVIYSNLSIPLLFDKYVTNSCDVCFATDGKDKDWKEPTSCVFFAKNNNNSRQFLKDWWLIDDDERHNKEWPWEQTNLYKLYPKYKNMVDTMLKLHPHVNSNININNYYERQEYNEKPILHYTHFSNHNHELWNKVTLMKSIEKLIKMGMNIKKLVLLTLKDKQIK